MVMTSRSLCACSFIVTGLTTGKYVAWDFKINDRTIGRTGSTGLSIMYEQATKTILAIRVIIAMRLGKYTLTLFANNCFPEKH